MDEPEHGAVCEAHHKHHSVRIHIDQKPYESPNPTSGEALYALGEIPAGYELYREVQGDREDEPIHRNVEHVHLKEDEHFHSSERQPKEYRLVVNARPKLWEHAEISYEQVIALAYETPPSGPNIVFTVIYHKGPGHTPEGTLTAGQSVKVKDRMIFDVTPTDRS